MKRLPTTRGAAQADDLREKETRKTKSMREGSLRKHYVATDLYPEIGKGNANRATDPESLAKKHEVDVRKVLTEANYHRGEDSDENYPEAFFDCLDPIPKKDI